MAAIARESLLRTQSQTFCHAFLHGTQTPQELLSNCFTANPSITEHGPPLANARLLFVGVNFTGRRSSRTLDSKTTCDDYFDFLGATLALSATSDSLPSLENFVVDTSANVNNMSGGTVLVKANARLWALRGSEKKGEGWEEEFVFLLSGFDEEGKIGKMEIWADNLSAWSAVGED